MSPEGEKAIHAGYDAQFRIVLANEREARRVRKIGLAAVRAALSGQIKWERAA